MLPQSRSYEELVRQFRWQVPAAFNIGVEVCDRWAERDPGKLALVAVAQNGRAQDLSYGWLRETSNRLANALTAHGIKASQFRLIEQRGSGAEPLQRGPPPKRRRHVLNREAALRKHRLGVASRKKIPRECRCSLTNPRSVAAARRAAMSHKGTIERVRLDVPARPH